MKKNRSQHQSRPSTRRSPARRRAPRKTAARRTPRIRSEARPAAKDRGVRARVSQVIGAMRRDGMSLTRASRKLGVGRNTVLRFSGSSLRKLPSGRYVARPTDRLPRLIRIPMSSGVREVTLRSSKDATLVGEYWNAVHAYLAKGDVSGLDRFRGLHIITADGERIVLLTDRASLDQLGGAGVLSFESIYARTV